MDRFNLFQFANNEHSHSAFWAWILQSTDADSETLQGPKGVGQSVIRLLDGPIPPGSVNVKTREPLRIRNRPNLRVDFGDDHSLFIEVATEPGFDPSIIEGYRESLNGEDKVALISTQFDAGEAEGTCPFLGLDDIREILWPHRDDHPLLSDYSDWADARNDRWSVLDEHVFAEDADAVASALSTLYGQIQVMEEITESMAGRLEYAPSNRSENPKTEFHFAEAGPDQDALFYRIDEYAQGHHISLKQHLDSTDALAWDDRENRLDDLRGWWTETAEDVAHQLTFDPPHNNGSKTREVARLYFKENAPSVVAEDLPKIHEAFTATLVEHGWDLGVQSS